jgi:hypothetical protein
MSPIVLRNEFSVAAVLTAASLILQSTGMALLIVWGRARFQKTHRLGPVRGALLMVRITGIIVGLHFLEVCLWSGFYRWRCFPSWESAFYFSAASYSTVGYGDLVLPARWRLLGPIESVAGVLMCGLSASFLFSVVTFMIQKDDRYRAGHIGELQPVPSLRSD